MALHSYDGFGSDEYHGFASESDYHEHHTMFALLEGAGTHRERREIRARIREIEAAKVGGASCHCAAKRSAA